MAPIRPGAIAPGLRNSKSSPYNPDQHEYKSHVRVGGDGEEPCSPIWRDGQDFDPRGRQAFRFSSYRRGAPIDLAKEIRHVVGNHVNDMKPERLRGWKANGRAHRLRCPVRIATSEFGEAADIGHGVVYGFAQLGVRRLTTAPFSCDAA